MPCGAAVVTHHDIPVAQQRIIRESKHVLRGIGLLIIDLAMVLDLQCVDRMQASAIVISALSAIVAAGCSGSGSRGVPDADTGSGEVTIEGQQVVISGFQSFNFQGVDNLSIKFTGTEIAVGSDLVISATHVGAGCDNTTNFITYRPMSAPQYMPSSTVDPACGLTIEAISAAGGRIRGNFSGTLHSINSIPATTRMVAATFDVPVPL
jgi:hypothetical protein